MQNFNQAAVKALFTALTDDASATSVFNRVNAHEPKSAPGAQISLSLWLASIDPLPRTAGLAAVAGVVVFGGRVYKSALAANAREFDAIDPAVLSACCTLMAAYSGGFTLGDTVLAVDLLGISGKTLSAQAAYVEYEGKQYRVLDLIVPVIIDDLWSEAA